MPEVLFLLSPPSTLLLIHRGISPNDVAVYNLTLVMAANKSSTYRRRRPSRRVRML